MKNTIIVVVVVLLIFLGVWYLQKPAPADEFAENNDSGAIVNETPALDSDSNIKETEVITETFNVKSFVVEGTNFAFAPNKISVSKGDKVKITFKNTQGFHDFVIDGYGVATKQDKAPFEEVIEFTADKTGSFEFYCSVGSHKAQGMKGILEVK